MSEPQPTTTQGAAPGWYPVDAQTVRYWDGHQWGDVTAPTWRPPQRDSARRAVVIFVIIVAIMVGLAIANAAVNGTDEQKSCDAFSQC
jgi:hypothetical protein